MPFVVAVDSIIEVRYYCWHVAGRQLGINGIKYLLTQQSPGTPVTSAYVADYLSTMVAPKYKAVLDSGASYMGCSVQDWPARLYVASWSKDGAGAGTVTGNDVPTQVSGLISLKTNYAKASGRGRIFVPFPSSTSNGPDGTPSSTYETALQALGNLFEGPVTGVVGPDLVNMTFYPIIAGKVRGTFDKRIVRVEAESSWATQRRRGNYGQPNTLPAELQ